MLVDFSVENFGPFCEKAGFSLLRTAIDDLPENLMRCDALVGDNLLNSAALFGPNGSGKSSLISAVKVFQTMIATPLPAGYMYPWYNPYRLSTKCSRSPTQMEIRFTIGDVLFHYGISFDKTHIVSEFLYQYPSGHKSLIFSRKEQKFFMARNISRGQKTISRMTNPCSTYLSVASQFNNDICMAVHHALVDDIVVVAGDPDTRLIHAATMIENNPGIRQLLLKTLEITDFGISDIECNVNCTVPGDLFSLDGGYGHNPRLSETGIHPSVRILLKHRFMTNDVSESSQYFPIQLESRGTKQMISTMVPIIEALYAGKTVFVDEFGSDLHPEVARWIVGQFKRHANPNRAQLVIATNDHTVMDTNELFRRDQIFFTRKDGSSGASEIYSLYDYEDSFGENVDISAEASQTMPFISSDTIM